MINICTIGRFTDVIGPLTHGAVVCLGLYGQKPCPYLKQCAKEKEMIKIVRSGPIVGLATADIAEGEFIEIMLSPANDIVKCNKIEFTEEYIKQTLNKEEQ